MSRPYVKSPSLNNAVVTGASGQLGTAFRDQVPDATFLGRLDVDLGDPESLTAVLDEMGSQLADQLRRLHRSRQGRGR